MLKLLQEESFDMHKIDSHFCEFRFIPRSMEELGTPAAVVAVFHDLGLKERWSINQETLSRWPFDKIPKPVIHCVLIVYLGLILALSCIVSSPISVIDLC